jgi:hypothetical protein
MVERMALNLEYMFLSRKFDWDLLTQLIMYVLKMQLRNSVRIKR